MALERFLARLRANAHRRSDDPDAGIEDLPNELIVPILLSLDGITLLRARRVCRRWNAIITDLLHGDTLSKKKQNLMWEKICRDVMPVPIIDELTNNFGTELKLETLIDWKDVYMRAHSCRADADLQEKVASRWEKPKGDDENLVVSIQLSGGGILTMYHGGLVTVWCYKTDTEIPFEKLSYVQSAAVVFGDVYDCGPYKFNSETFLNHHVMLHGSNQGKVTATDLTTIPKKSKSAVIFSVNYEPIKSMWIQGSWLSVGFRTSVTIGRLAPQNGDGNESDDCLPQFDSLMTFDWNGDQMSSTFLWELNNLFKLTFLDWSGRSMVYDGRSLSVGRPIKFDESSDFCQGDLYSPNLEFPEGVERFTLFSEWGSPFKTKIFHGTVKIVLTGSNYLLISAESELYRMVRPQDLWPTTQSIVTAFNYVAGVLILGTESGKIFAFRSKNTKDIMSMMLNKPIWSQTIWPHESVDQIEVQLEQGLLTLAVLLGKRVVLTKKRIG